MGKRRNVKRSSQGTRALLREIRVKLGLNQVEVSLRLGRYKTYMTKVETGERTLTLDEFEEICDTYGEDPAAVLKRARRWRPPPRGTR